MEGGRLTFPVGRRRQQRRIPHLHVDEVEPHPALTLPAALPAVQAVGSRLIAFQMPLATREAAGPDPPRFCYHGRCGLFRGCRSRGRGQQLGAALGRESCKLLPLRRRPVEFAGDGIHDGAWDERLVAARRIPCAARDQRAEAEAGGEEARGRYVCRQGCESKAGSVPEVAGSVPRLGPEMFVEVEVLELGCRMGGV